MKVVALAGGVGGARLVDGLAQVCDDLSVVVNTGDDFEHWGLRICPDLDTVMYTLAGLGDRSRGWGLRDESFNALLMMERYGGGSWFSLGDRDLATHIRRTALLREGRPLSEVTRTLSTALGVRPRLLPMCEGPRPTRIRTADGWLPFQEWLVKQRAPPVLEVSSEGDSTPAAGVLEVLDAADLVVLAPSNPYVSVDPILAMKGLRERVAATPVVALSPIVGGQAVKGPLASMIPALAGVPASAQAVLDHYDGLIDALVVERGDRVDGRHVATSTIMGDRADRARLAAELLDLARTL